MTINRDITFFYDHTFIFFIQTVIKIEQSLVFQKNNVCNFMNSVRDK